MAEHAVKFKEKTFPLTGPQLKPGDKAPDFACVNNSLEVIHLGQTPAKARLFLSVPSLDTPVCSEETKRFDHGLAELKDKAVCYTISLDLPFAQKRYCAAEHINTVQTLSDLRDKSFGKNYGVLIEGFPGVPILSRAVFVVDKHNKITYAEYVSEVGKHPDYDKALQAVKAAASA